MLTRVVLIGICLFASSTLSPENARAEAPHALKISFILHGREVSDVLVIVKSLDTYRESFRSLSDANGFAGEHALSPGLYRAITTCPFDGICRNSLQEFLVAEQTASVSLDVYGAPPTKGWGASWRTLHFVPLRVHCTDGSGFALSGVRILVRDDDESLLYEKWYKTNNSGDATVDVSDDEDMVIVAVYDSKITVSALSSTSTFEMRNAQTKGETSELSLRF